MIIRSAFGLRLDFSEGLNRLRAGARWRWLPVALAFSLLPDLLLAQIAPGTAGSQPSGSASTLPSSVVSAFTPNGGVSAPAGYILSANDQVAVEVFGEEDLRTNGRLNPEGNLSVPLLGSIHLAGLTLTQAASKLTDLYGRDYLVNPKVNVMLLGYAKRRFSILGQVNRPGSYEMPESSPGGIDLLEAIAMASGYTRIAAPERVTVRRHTAAAGDQIFKVNAKRFTKGSGGGFHVEPGDTITVGESIF
jgi:protein involved in polysaccharide export with SLBB domain